MLRRLYSSGCCYRRCSGKRVELRELAAYALQQWPLTDIEEAPGRLLPREHHTIDLEVMRNVLTTV